MILNRRTEAEGQGCVICSREDPGQRRVVLDIHYTQHDTTYDPALQIHSGASQLVAIDDNPAG